MSRLVLVIDSVPHDDKRDRVFDVINAALDALAAEGILEDGAWEWFI